MMRSRALYTALAEHGDPLEKRFRTPQSDRMSNEMKPPKYSTIQVHPT